MRIISAGHTRAMPGDLFDWHLHADLDEFCLVEKGCTTIGHAGRRRAARAGQLFLFRRRERHGFWNGAGQRCELAVVHFDAEKLAAAQPALKSLLAGSPARRVWSLSPDATRALAGLFRGLLRERVTGPSSRALAEVGWMHLILATSLRIAHKSAIKAASAPNIEPELERLRERIETMVESRHGTGGLFLSIPRYDSLRHRFRRQFGVSPHALLIQMKIERAKYLLLNTSLSIKEIAERLGYSRQHEFTRAFHLATKRAPTVWRNEPE